MGCIFFLISLVEKKKQEQKLTDLFIEMKNLSLRITVVETRMEERMMYLHGSSRLSSISHSSSLASPNNAKKRGRPRKIKNE
jgi:hypothetical protein